MDRSFEATLVRLCAPTLAGIKPASLFSFRASTLGSIRRKVSRWDRRLSPSGVSVRILWERPCSTSAVVYVYRARQLEPLLASEGCRSFLAQAGYRPAGLQGMLAQLSRRLSQQDGFPHEIGLFLGYPLEDVVGFIEHQGRNFTCCGLWKSYGDPEVSQRQFDRCRRCTDIYIRLFAQGAPLDKLVAA